MKQKKTNKNFNKQNRLKRTRIRYKQRKNMANSANKTKAIIEKQTNENTNKTINKTGNKRRIRVKT